MFPYLNNLITSIVPPCHCCSRWGFPSFIVVRDDENKNKRRGTSSLPFHTSSSGKQFENDMQLYLMLYMILDDILWYQTISYIASNIIDYL
jgi:hypothetical protein